MSLPRKSTRNGTRGYAHLVEVDVPVARVWRALTDPGLIRIWSGQEAEIDPRKGGAYRIGKRSAGSREAHIDIFDVNRRLRLIYLNNPDWPPADSACVDDFIIDWDQSYKRIRMGWERFMARIKVTLESPPVPKKPKKVVPKDPPLPGLDY